MIALRQPRACDIAYVASRLKTVERREVGALGWSPIQALRMSLIGSTHAWTITNRCRPFAMVGVQPVDAVTSEGKIWFVSTVDAPKASRLWLSLARDTVDEMLRHYRILSNECPHDSLGTLSWLRRLDFEIEAEPYTVGSERMVRFRRG
jgi:hypothetical protein